MPTTKITAPTAAGGVTVQGSHQFIFRVLRLVGDTYDQFWVVSDPFQFENITFSRTVEGYKYLSCAECEKEVIGAQLLPEQQVYIAVNKVKYIQLYPRYAIHKKNRLYFRSTNVSSPCFTALVNLLTSKLKRVFWSGCAVMRQPFHE